MNSTRLALLLALVASPVISAQEAGLKEARPGITVTGDAAVNVSPDRIEVSLGIETSDSKIVMAKQKNNDIVKKLLAAVQELGIPDKDIQTSYLSVQPVYNDKQALVRYSVSNDLVVTVNSPVKLEALVTQVLELGVNYIRGICFQTTELKRRREQARELALKAAREKAEKMAAVFGQKIGKPISITENQSGSWFQSGRANANVQAQISQDHAGGSDSVGDTIALGKIAIRASVTVVFELKD